MSIVLHIDSKVASHSNPVPPSVAGSHHPVPSSFVSEVGSRLSAIAQALCCCCRVEPDENIVVAPRRKAGAPLLRLTGPAAPAGPLAGADISFLVVTATSQELADVSYAAHPTVPGLYVFSLGYSARASIVKVPEAVNTTPPPAMVDYTYLGTFGVVTPVGGINNWAVLTTDGDQTAFRTASTPWASVPRAAPSAVPPAKGRFYLYKRAADGLFVLRSADYTPAAGGFLTAVADALWGGFFNGDTATPTDPFLAYFGIDTFPVGCLLPSTIDGTGAITEKFTYYITCPHATLNVTNPAVIDYKQLQYSATTTPDVVAATGYDYSTQGWVFEAVAGSANTYKIRSVGNTANYILNGTNDAFLIEAHPTAFGAFSIRVPGTATLKTYLYFSAAGVMSWTKATSNSSANAAFFFRMGETSFPRMVN